MAMANTRTRDIRNPILNLIAFALFFSLGCKVASVTPDSGRPIVPDAGPEDVADDHSQGDEPLASDVPASNPPGTTSCNDTGGTQSNMGCQFYAADIPLMLVDQIGKDGLLHQIPFNCFAIFVVNPLPAAVKLTVDRGGISFPLARIARTVRNQGDLQYQPYADNVGVPAGEIAVVFLAGSQCPAGTEAAYPESQGLHKVTTVDGSTLTSVEAISAIDNAFHIASDRPVIAYAMVPYGGAASFASTATLLLPVEAWGTKHVAARPIVEGTFEYEFGGFQDFIIAVASQDDTLVSFQPTEAVNSGTGVPAIAVGGVGQVHLQAGQYIQL